MLGKPLDARIQAVADFCVALLAQPGHEDSIPALIEGGLVDCHLVVIESHVGELLADTSVGIPGYAMVVEVLRQLVGDLQAGLNYADAGDEYGESFQWFREGTQTAYALLAT